MKGGLFLFFFLFTSICNGQKFFSEGTISYDVITVVKGQIVSGNVKSVQSVKGAHTRVELNNALGKTTTLYDSRDGEGAILRDFGAQKIMVPITKEQLDAKNKKYENLVFVYTNETKQILNYQCQKATATLADGTQLEVFFSRELLTDNTDIGFQFGKIPGLALEFSSGNTDVKVTYIASSISFEPIPVQQFDIPTSGYRVMSYEESQKKN